MSDPSGAEPARDALDFARRCFSRPLHVLARSVGAVVCYGLAVAMAHAESLQIVWAAYVLWVIAAGLLLWPTHPVARLRVAIGDAAAVIGVVALCVLARSVFLDIYPFHVAGDAIRDGGLYPIAIGNGELRPWGWGPYQSMTLVLPTTIAAFYRVFGGVHFYQFCSIAFAAAETIVLYALVRRAYGRIEAVVACVVLALLPAHLAFSRTETSIIFSSFWTTVLLAAGYRYLCRPDRRSLVVVAVLAGLAANFHSSVRAVCFLLAGWVVLCELWRAAKCTRWKTRIMQTASRMTIGFGAALIGFGPSLWFLDTVLFGGDRIELKGGLSGAASSYLHTLLAYCYEPLSGHLPFWAPLVTPLLGIPLVAGAAVALTRSASRFSRLVLSLLLVIPLTNSAMTDVPIAAYRLAPLFPLLAIAISSAPRLFQRSRWWARTMSAIALAGSAYHLYLFFLPAPMAAIEGGGMTREMAYAYAHAVRAARSDPRLVGAPELCWGVSPRQREALQLLHYQENLRFYLPNARHEIRDVTGLPDTTVYLSRSCAAAIGQGPWTTVSVCDVPDAYRCGGTGPITLFVQQ